MGYTIQTWVRHLRREGSLSCQRISAFNVKLCCFSTNCIVWIKPLKILLSVHPHSIAFENVIALYYFILLIHTNVEWWCFSGHLPAKTSRVAIFNWQKSICINHAGKRFISGAMGWNKNDSYIYFCRITIPAFPTGDLKGRVIYRTAFTILTYPYRLLK